jgi:circadian clock protein KaiB
MSLYVLQLYVTGASPRSVRAIINIRKICDTYLQGRYELSVVDLYQQPALAAGQNIIASPTLVKEFPQPPRRIVGDLSDSARVVDGLGIPATGLSEGPTG